MKPADVTAPLGEASIEHGVSGSMPAPVKSGHHLISACRRGAIPMCAFARTLLRLLGRVPVALTIIAAAATAGRAGL